MTKPNSTLTKVFHALLNKHRGISERDFQLNGYRQRLSTIRDLLLSQGVVLHDQWVKFENEFKHKGQYKKYFILPADLDKATEVYETIVKKK